MLWARLLRYKAMEKVYLDYAATSYIKDEVFLCMLPYLKERFGNPSGIYASAREAKRAIESARSKIAELLYAKSPREVYFTSGGTEGDNWALRGVMHANACKGKHIVTTNAEHHAVLSVCEALEREGYEVTYLPVDCYGGVSVEQVIQAIRQDTVLVSVMAANNEVGTINPIEEIAEAVHQKGVLFHADAVAAVGHRRLDASVFDLLTISGHKFYGPKGVGVLYIKAGLKIAPLLYGGKQERELRSGTENVAGIVGLAAALELAVNEMEHEELRLKALRDGFEQSIKEALPGVSFNGSSKSRLNNYTNVCLPIGASAALVALDMAGIECSAGSACMTGGVIASHVLRAMGLTEKQAMHALRFTLGATTTAEQLAYVVQQLVEICK